MTGLLGIGEIRSWPSFAHQLKKPSRIFRRTESRGFLILDSEYIQQGAMKPSSLRGRECWARLSTSSSQHTIEEIKQPTPTTHDDDCEMPNRERKMCVLLGALHHCPQAKFPHGRTPHDIEISRWADYLQDLLAIATDETCMSPCSSFVFFIPVAAASSLAFSFALCTVTFETVQ